MRALAEEIARSLGCWRERWEMDRSAVPIIHDVRVQPADNDGMLDVRLRGMARSVAVDAGTVIVLLIGWARGLRVDMGECAACRGRGGKRGLASWEWRVEPHVRRSYRRDGSVRSETFVRWNVDTTGWSHASYRARRDHDVDVMHMCRPCPACAVDAQPTGRFGLAWEAAALAAIPQPPCCAGVPLSQIECGCEGQWEPADEAVREALSVAADAMQTDGDPLGVIVAAWLSGTCPTCEGYGDCGWCGGHPARSALLAAPAPRHRRVAHADQAVHGVLDCPRCDGAGVCPACRGCGAVLGAFEADIRALAMVRSTDRPKSPPRATTRAN